MTTFEIKIKSIKTITTNNLNNIVKTIDYTIIGTNNNVTASMDVTITLDNPDPNNFIQYENLTENQVIDWINTKTVGIDNVKQHIEATIMEKLNNLQPVETPLPWVNT